MPGPLPKLAEVPRQPVTNYLTKKNIVCAIKKFDLDINENEFIALVGPSGCGKSTILSIIGGLEEKTSGIINFKDTTLASTNDFFIININTITT